MNAYSIDEGISTGHLLGCKRGDFQESESARTVIISIFPDNDRLLL